MSSSDQLPNSRKVYVNGEVHCDVRVPFREISLAPTKSMDGTLEPNEPVRVYDTSGPWGDMDFRGDVEEGLPSLRANWIRDRGDVDEIEGRLVRPQDDGYLSVPHAEHSAKRNGNSEFGMRNAKLQRKPLRAKPGKVVTQLWYARQGIITPEMEFIAVRENHGLQSRNEKVESRNDLGFAHAGESFGAAIPKEINPRIR